MMTLEGASGQAWHPLPGQSLPSPLPRPTCPLHPNAPSPPPAVQEGLSQGPGIQATSITCPPRAPTTTVSRTPKALHLQPGPPEGPVKVHDGPVLLVV